MITATPLTAAALGHRALQVAAANSGNVVALSKEGIGSLLAPDHLTVTRFEVGCHVGGIAISPNGKQLALLEDNAMSLITLPDLAEQVRVEDAIEGCLFSPSGRLLWSAVHTSSDTAALEIRETKSCEVVACAEVPDPFESSGLMLFSHPSEDR